MSCRVFLITSTIVVLVALNTVFVQLDGMTGTTTSVIKQSVTTSAYSSTDIPLPASQPTSYVIHTCLHPAGLYDRREVISRLLELALYLEECQRRAARRCNHQIGDRSNDDNDPSVQLQFPKPRQAFSTSHSTSRRKVSSQLTWDDFWSFTKTSATTFGRDDSFNQTKHQTFPKTSPLVATTKVNFHPIWYYFGQNSQHGRNSYLQNSTITEIESTQQILPPPPERKYCRSPRRWNSRPYIETNIDGNGFDMEKLQGKTRFSTFARQNENATTLSQFVDSHPSGQNSLPSPPHRHRRYHHLISTTPEQVIDHFDYIRLNLTTISEPFVWEICVNFYSFHKQMMSHLETLRLEQQEHERTKQDEKQTFVSCLQIENNSTGNNITDSSTPMIMKRSPPLASYASISSDVALPWIKRGGKKYADLSPSPRIQWLIREVWNRIDSIDFAGNFDRVNKMSDTVINRGWDLIAYLHIRRGDTMHECDSSVPKLRRYLNCSLYTLQKLVPSIHKHTFQFESMSDDQNATSITELEGSSLNRAKSNIRVNLKLLVSTNERKRSYHQSVQRMIENDLSPLKIVSSLAIDHQSRVPTTMILNIRYINADSLVWTTLREAVSRGMIPSTYLNNFHVFMLLDQLMTIRPKPSSTSKASKSSSSPSSSSSSQLASTTSSTKGRYVDFKLQQRRIRQCNDCDEIDLDFRSIQDTTNNR